MFPVAGSWQRVQIAKGPVFSLSCCPLLPEELLLGQGLPLAALAAVTDLIYQSPGGLVISVGEGKRSIILGLSLGLLVGLQPSQSVCWLPPSP